MSQYATRFHIYTNVKDDSQVAIKGTLPICATCKEMFYVAENSLCVIGRRSGFMEYLSMSKGKTFIFGSFAFQHALFFLLYDTKIMFPFSNAHTIYFDEYSLDFIKNFVSGVFKKFPGRLNLLTRVMNDKDTTFVHSYDQAIEFIIESVKELIANEQQKI